MKFYFKCPHCKADDRFYRVREKHSRMGWALFFLGGLLAALHFASEQCQRVQCGRCGWIFRQPAIPVSPLVKFAFWVFVVVSLIGGVGFVLVTTPELASDLPEHPLLTLLEEQVAASPRAVVYVVLTLFSFVIITCLAAIGIGNVLFRKQLSQQFQMRPSTYQPKTTPDAEADHSMRHG